MLSKCKMLRAIGILYFERIILDTPRSLPSPFTNMKSIKNLKRVCSYSVLAQSPRTVHCNIGGIEVLTYIAYLKIDEYKME